MSTHRHFSNVSGTAASRRLLGADRGHRGTDAIDPSRTHSRVLALNGKTIKWRHNALPLGTKANRARFKGMNAVSNWPPNRLLLALPPRNLKRLMPELEQIRCERVQILLDVDSTLDHVFLPDSGVIS